MLSDNRQNFKLDSVEFVKTRPSSAAGKPFEEFIGWAIFNGFGSILLEAGPTLTTLAFEAGVVSQSAITRTPVAKIETPKAQQNPFDEDAVLVSFAQSEDASFSLWSH